MLAGAGGLGCIPPTPYVLPERGQQRLPEPPGTIALASCGRWRWKWLRNEEKECWQRKGSFPFPRSGKQSKP